MASLKPPKEKSAMQQQVKKSQRFVEAERRRIRPVRECTNGVSPMYVRLNAGACIYVRPTIGGTDPFSPTKTAGVQFGIKSVRILVRSFFFGATPDRQLKLML